MMKTLILICALGMPRAECSIDSAVSVVQGPDASHLAQCGFLGQAYLASTAMANYLDGEHYPKVLCTAGGTLKADAGAEPKRQHLADVAR